MLKIDGKTFMNIQEAVQWLLENNALPFQCTANYAGYTEMGMGTIVNPSPAKVRIGSLIFFADSKVSTVVGITENGFICSDQYNNLVDDIAYVTGVAINASGHLITTLSDGQTIDAGIIKQVSSFSINDSQQLVVTYNNGTTQNLGAIFSGNVNIAGNLTADSIIENMSGYSYENPAESGITKSKVYVGACKNGNKLTFVVALKINFDATYTGTTFNFGRIVVPQAVYDKLYPVNFGGTPLLEFKTVEAVPDSLDPIPVNFYSSKGSTSIFLRVTKSSDMAVNTDYYVRIESTYLLNDSL